MADDLLLDDVDAVNVVAAHLAYFEAIGAVEPEALERFLGRMPPAPMSVAEIAQKTTNSMGAIAGDSEMNVTGAGPGR